MDGSRITFTHQLTLDTKIRFFETRSASTNRQYSLNQTLVAPHIDLNFIIGISFLTAAGGSITITEDIITIGKHI